MKIGIIGSGNMGRSLGILWAEQGHEVFFGSRTTEKGKEVAEIAGQTTHNTVRLRFVIANVLDKTTRIVAFQHLTSLSF
jgi:predicted dinucleotide-binding enzyme